MATACIFCGNDQDFGPLTKTTRDEADSIIDERTLEEIYYPPFRALVQEAHVGAIMASYNLLNGEHSTQNAHLLREVLKGAWGFQGLVMSDWGATHDTVGAANGGLDLEMPRGQYFNLARVLPALQSGAVKLEVIDDKVRRILREFFAFGFFDHPQKDLSIPPDDPQSTAVALDMAREEIVLLKNEGHLLPFDRRKIRSVAVLGPNADPAVCGGSGSSNVFPLHPVSVLDGIRELAGSAVQVVAVPWGPPPAAGASFPLAERIAQSVNAARTADVVVVCVGFKDLSDSVPRVRDLAANEGEGADRTYGLPPGQIQLLQEVAAVNPHIVVILNAGGGVDWSGWLDRMPALIDAWYPGEQGGRALAEILFGDVNPSGKLPATFEKRWEDNPSSRYYDGVTNNQAVYGEGIFTGYRGFDAKGIEPQFPFGYGLSYTTFRYGNLQIERFGTGQNPAVTVRFRVENTGKAGGTEIAEIYVGDPHASVPRPPKELKGFVRAQLAPGESKTISVALDRSAFSYYDVSAKTWKFEPGKFVIMVGSSSREIRLEQAVGL